MGAHFGPFSVGVWASLVFLVAVVILALTNHLVMNIHGDLGGAFGVK